MDLWLPPSLAASVVLTEAQWKRLQQRRRQIELGKATQGYRNYVHWVPRENRNPHCLDHPVTPRMDLCVSRREFDMSVRHWRYALHRWDRPSSSSQDSSPSSTEREDDNNDMMQSKQHPTDESKYERRMQQREKQIGYGKATVGYRIYLRCVPPEERLSDNPSHPVTPRLEEPVSKREWDAALRHWRRALHRWDPFRLASWDAR